MRAAIKTDAAMIARRRARHVDHTEHGETERERVRGRKRRDDARDVESAGARSARRERWIGTPRRLNTAGSTKSARNAR